LKGNSGELARLLLTLLGIALISSLASLWEGELGAFSSRAVGAVSSVMLFDSLSFLLKGASESLREINSFFGAVIPITVAVNSIGVSPTTSSTQAIGMGLTLGMYSFITSEVMTALVLAVFISSAASGIDPIFGRISRGIKNLLITSLGIISVFVGATFSLQSAISAAADSAIVRGTRYAISSSVPIVGNAVSGALGVAIGGVSYARGIVGGGAIAVILSLMLSPLILLFAYRVCLKAGAALAGICAPSGCEGMLTSFIGSLDTLIAVYSLSVVVYIAELVSFLKGGGVVA
jgi:stage III sporulation protein AE